MPRHSLRALIIGCTLAAPGLAAAQEFSIHSKVFDGKTLIATSTTLFADGNVYDILAQPDETIILSPEEGTFEFLDNSRQVRTLVTADALTTFGDELRRKAEASDSELMRFHAAPEFREELDPDSRELVLESKWMEYRAKTAVPPNAEALRSYENYVSWQARLNTLLNPGSPPAGPRLALNAALARRQVLAEEVTLKRTSLVPGFGKTLRAEHLYTWRLNDADRQRIAEARKRRETYRFVAPSEYVRRTPSSAKR